MKIWIICIAILSISIPFKSLSCGYYPSGEEARFTLFHPTNFDFDGFTPFFYSAYYYYYSPYEEDMEKLKPDIEEEEVKNILLWQKLTKVKINKRSIHDALYRSPTDLTKKSTNKFVRQLHRENKHDLLEYMAFVSRVSNLNTYHSDPWEKNDRFDAKLRVRIIEEINQKIQNVQDHFLKRRYAFLAVRLCFYEGQYELMNRYWEKYIQHTEKDIVYYWGLYYWNVHQPDSPERDNRFFEVFYNASGKRRTIRSNYLNENHLYIGKGELNHPVYEKDFLFYKSLRSTGKVLRDIKRLHKITGGNHELDFLILREVSKLEDWLLSPQFVMGSPAIYEMDDCCYEDVSDILFPRDVQYARQVLRFIRKNKPKKNYIWDMSEAYLNYLLGNYKTSKAKVQSALKKFRSKKEQKLLKQILYLNQAALKDKSLDLTKFDVESLDVDNKFILGLAKEFERTGQIEKAIIVYSWMTLFEDEEDYYNYHFVWQSPNKNENSWGDFFVNYKYYIDFIAGPKEIKNIIRLTKLNFDRPNFKTLKSDINYLYDLLGTKYLRRGKLNLALKYFDKAGQNYYINEDNSYDYYLNANPFYADLNSHHKVSKADTVSYTKPQIIRRLLKHLRASDVEGNKSYHYNAIANCYYNMTYHGNSWMMRRYAWSISEFHNDFVDEKEYHRANLAKSYYYKAYLSAEESDSAAYYLAMAGKCEALSNIDKWDGEEDRDFTNKYYRTLKKKYADWSDIYLGGCYAFDQAK